ncbi:tetratricopeptide repeat protein [Listeria rocourtiae]|uniref:tetratricopeptide repeat protein n=1 Tax=Listeria rocourtiae TaxID=647910 RepID=UPI0016269B29|nr:tetratricopeptide repeat protein [Listeria rocourtiae]MBC1435590.1 tetratricopeptide repeat protein [Listeria rocourtiae]
MKPAAILVLLESGQYQNAKESAKNALLTESDNALLNYYVAWSCDGLGDETEAISYYEKALKIGLPEDCLADAYIGLGSTYRAVGNYEKADEIFQQALATFPKNQALAVFASMSLYNKRHYKEAMQLAIKIIGETSNDPSIMAYKNAIINYSADLDAVWD